MATSDFQQDTQHSASLEVEAVKKGAAVSSKDTSISAASSHDAASIRSATKTIVDVQTGDEDVEATAQTESQPEAAIYSVFTGGMKRFIVSMATASSLFSPISSFIYLPAIDELAKEYGTTVARINLTVTTYQILQGIAPMIWANMADTTGRRPVFILAFTVYLGANLGLALQHSYPALMVLRALQSAGSSQAIALGSAVVADVASPAERGGWMSYVQAGVMLGPAIAPTLGGIFTQFVGWRWIFWFLLIANGLFLAVYIFINPETCRNVVDDGSLPAPKINKSVWQLIKDSRMKARGESPDALTEKQQQRAEELAVKRGKFRFPNPVASLACLKEPDVALVLVYQGIMVAAFYTIMVPITPVFAQTYGYNALQIGLCYIPFAAGAAAGAIGFGKLLNWNFARTAQKLGMKVDRKRASRLREFPIERARLEWIFYPNALAAAGMLCWGWTLSRGPNLAAPLIILAFTALGSVGSSTMVNTLLVDLYPQAPATVVAANNLTKCMCSATASAVIQYMIDAMGLGWCYTFMAALILLSSSLLVFTMRKGPQWREKRTIRLEKKEEQERQAREKEIRQRDESEPATRQEPQGTVLGDQEKAA